MDINFLYKPQNKFEAQSYVMRKIRSLVTDSVYLKQYLLKVRLLEIRGLNPENLKPQSLSPEADFASHIRY